MGCLPFSAGRLHVLQGLGQVSDNIRRVLNAHRQADQVGGHAGGLQLRVGHLPVGRGGGVEHTGFRIGHMGENCYEDKVAETLAALQGTLEKKGIKVKCDLAEAFRKELV